MLRYLQSRSLRWQLLQAIPVIGLGASSWRLRLWNAMFDRMLRFLKYLFWFSTGFFGLFGVLVSWLPTFVFWLWRFHHVKKHAKQVVNNPIPSTCSALHHSPAREQTAPPIPSTKQRTQSHMQSRPTPGGNWPKRGWVAKLETVLFEQSCPGHSC